MSAFRQSSLATLGSLFLVLAKARRRVPPKDERDAGLAVDTFLFDVDNSRNLAKSVTVEQLSGSNAVSLSLRS